MWYSITIVKVGEPKPQKGNFMEETMWVDVQYRFAVPVRVFEDEYEDIKKLGKNSSACNTITKYATESLNSLFHRLSLYFEDIGVDRIYNDEGNFCIEY